MSELIDLPGYEGIYKINRDGQVWSCARKGGYGRMIPGRYLKPRKDHAGRLRISLSKNGQVVIWYITDLVKLAFSDA